MFSLGSGVTQGEFGWLRAHYELARRWSREEFVRGDEEGKGFANSWEAMTGLVPLEQDGKDRLDRYLRPLLEQWSGVEPLELVVIYGIREYRNGSWLSRHVDRINTHAVSVRTPAPPIGVVASSLSLHGEAVASLSLSLAVGSGDLSVCSLRGPKRP